METENRLLIKKFYKTGTVYLSILFIVTLICVFACLVIDLNPEYKMDLYQIVKNCSYLKDYISVLKTIKYRLHDCIELYCNMIITYNTILTAALVFFYSIMDNRRGGIPYRTLISYTFGSWTLPIMFMVTLLLMPIVYLIQENLRWTVFFLLCYMFFIQIFIIIIILRSSSFTSAMRVLTNVEFRQYRILDPSHKRGKYIFTPFLKLVPVKREYIGQYFSRHMREIFMSTELLPDRIRMIRSILWVPFYKNKKRKLSIERLYKNNLQSVYRFYFENISSLFDCSKKQDKNELFNMLYEFLENFEKWFHESVKSNDLTKKTLKILVNPTDVYHMVYCGILNAAMFSDIDEREVFCNYVFDHYMKEKALRNTQIDLYILFHEVFFLVKKKSGYDITDLQEIKSLYEWESLSIEKIQSYGRYWKIWCDCFSINRENKMKHFIRASHTMCGICNESEIIFDIMQYIKKKKRKIQCGQE